MTMFDSVFRQQQRLLQIPFVQVKVIPRPCSDGTIALKRVVLPLNMLFFKTHAILNNFSERNLLSQDFPGAGKAYVCIHRRDKALIGQVTTMAVEKQLQQSIDAVPHELQANGYAVIPGFLSEAEIKAMKIACSRLMDKNLDTTDAHLFATGDNQNDIHGDDYFLTSNDKIRFFFELDAVKSVDDREIIVENKHQAVNKIGHALHWLEPTFKAVSHSDKVKAVCHALQLEDPRIVQSMYIFKQPFIGGAVSIHKDSTFLNTQPSSRLVGFWFALEDATEDNGCLWFAKGTHREEPTQRMIRNEPGKTPMTIFRGENRQYKDEEFTAAPVKAGTLVVIHANIAHKSLQNTSPQSRHAYTFHIVDFGNGTEYSKENWLAPSEVVPFRNVYDVEVQSVQ